MKLTCLKLNRTSDKQNTSLIQPIKINFLQMKKHLSALILLLLCISFSSTAFSQKIKIYKKNGILSTRIPKREKNQTDVIELRCEPIDTVRIAVIGVGNRGNQALRRLSFIPTAKIVAVSDVKPEYIERAKNILSNRPLSSVTFYSGKDDWKQICKREDIDLVYVCTHWDLHAPIAIEALNNGKHTAVEIPIALSLEECWDLINSAEKNRKHCMILENCIYDDFELTAINMVQQGLIGEVVHAEGAYIHDLREYLFSPTKYWDYWRLKHNTENEGNLYPTHGLGPVAHAMNIHRGDKMNYLTCVSSNQFALTNYAKKKFGEDSPEAKTVYKNGDINTTMIKTEKGKSILIQHDVSSARPYSRLTTFVGLKGYLQGYPTPNIALESEVLSSEEFLPKAQLDSILKEYQHPIVKDIISTAKEIGGHGGMDYIMDYRLIFCLNNGLPLDMDVYDGVEWSSLVPLTRISLQQNSIPVEIPDFTRGAWNKIDKITYHQTKK